MTDKSLKLSREIAQKHELAMRRQARGDYEAIQRAKADLAANAAQPPPSAHGVAELLAICEQRQKSAFVAVVSCDEIVRLLTPGGADGGQS